MSSLKEYGNTIVPKFLKRSDDGSDQALYAVYAQEFNCTYTLFLGDGFSRTFTSDTMPERIRVSLTMINAAFDWTSKGWFPPLLFPNTFPRDMYDVGWRTSLYEYCFVLEEPYLNELRGNSVQNCTLKGHDPRRQSQSESKEDS